MRRLLTIGVDVGTTTTKAALFDLTDPREPLLVSRRPSPRSQPRPGWSETGPDEAAGTVIECVAELAAELADHRMDAHDVVAIGVSGTASGAWLLAHDGQPVRPAILWNDSRASHIVEAWRRDGTVDQIFETSGNVPFPGYTLPVLKWLKLEEGHSLRKAQAVLCSKDWIRYRLTGVVATDVTDASYVPFDIRRRSWGWDLLELCGIADLAHLLPRLAGAEETAPLLGPVAERMGLPAGIPVAVGATDIVAGLIGSGSIHQGRALTILGTSANSSIVSEQPQFAPRGVGIMAAGPGEHWTRTMINTSGSTTLDWAAQLLGLRDVPELVQLAAGSTGDDDRPMLVPYLGTAGTVSPRYDPLARASLVGLRADQSRASVARAAIEGLGYAVADCYTAMHARVDELTAIGGAARSDLLLQTIADSLGAVVHRLAGEEHGARGVALLAGRAAGQYDRQAFESACADLHRARTFEPGIGQSMAAERLATYRTARDAAADLASGWS